MSKRTRYADNSKRQQPVQQQRAEAARQATGQSKAAKGHGQQPARERTGGNGR
ncbi:MAG TPA: hypothetical protein VFE82_05110 [Ramlibacter sp.]|uniref:hypothetical protein n=1 Tax=Ramlibacter sp. TaxID=1917967 RepID=UPI002D3A49AE|nr:hypothetical protein [Ramlibacter sp.]HZY17838.1 hypothetical protein [Ramlibacter sp.]